MNRERLIPLTDLFPSWFRRPLLPVAVGKEWPALRPFWLASLALAFVVGLGPRDVILPLAQIALFLSSAAVGASVVGHEFTHRTLGLLLAQPARRAHLWQRKLGIAAAALLTSTAPVCLRFVAPDYGAGRGSWAVVGLGLGTVLSGLCVAPWLTLLTRSTLAGTVFTAVLPMLFAIVVPLVLLARGVLGDGLDQGPDQMALGLFVFLVVAQWPVGAYLGRRAFLRIESLEGAGHELSAPRWRRRRQVRAGHAAAVGGWRRWVVRKELQLQRASLLIAGLFACAWGLCMLVWLLRPSWAFGDPVLSTPVYAAFIALLVGALAGAEERQLGTIESQLVLPVSVARQWVWKSGVVLALALTLGAALPVGLWALTPSEELRRTVLAQGFDDWLPMLAPLTLLLAGLALYVSSICRTTVRALLVSILITLILTLVLGTVGSNGVVGVLVSVLSAVRWAEPVPERPFMMILAVLMGLALAGHGLTHYRTIEQRFRRVALHVVWLGVYPILILGLYMAAGFAAAYWGKEPAVGTFQPAQPPPPLAPRAAALFSPNDFADLGTLARKLRESKDPVSEYLAGRLSPSTRERLDVGLEEAPPERLATNLAEDLNAVVVGELIYRSDRFARVHLRPMLAEAASAGPQGDLAAFVNRMLIEDAYPDEIRRGLLMLMVREGMRSGMPGSLGVDVRLHPGAIRGIYRATTGGATNSGTNANPMHRGTMDVRLLQRYGLLPKPVPAGGTGGATNR